MTVVASIGDAVQLQFTVFDIDGVTPLTGLVNSDFTKSLFVDSASSAQPVSVAELSGGTYVATFSPDANGLWYVEAFAVPSEEAFGCYVQVGTPADWTADIAQGVWHEVLPDGGAVDSAGDRMVRVTNATESVRDALIAASLSATAGSTSTVVLTGATQLDGFYDGMTVVVRNSSGNVVRRVTGYANASGAFTLDPPLPFAPSAGDAVIVLGILGEVAVAGNADVAVQLAEIHRLLGLDAQSPLCVSKAAQTAGSIRLEQTEIGDKIVVQRVS